MVQTLANKLRKAQFKRTAKRNNWIKDKAPEKFKEVLKFISDEEFDKSMMIIESVELIIQVGQLNPSVAGFVYSLTQILLLPMKIFPWRPIRDLAAKIDAYNLRAVQIWYGDELVLPTEDEIVANISSIVNEIINEEKAINKENFNAI